MMNVRHPNDDERRQVRKLVDDIGAVELIRLLAQIVSHDHPDLHEGIQARTQLLAVAKSLNEQNPGADR